MERLIAVFIIAVVVVAYGIVTQRKFISLDEISQNALSAIGLQQEARWNALTSLAYTTKSYAEFEQKTLQEIIGKRIEITSDSQPADVQENEHALDEASGRLIALAEAYPQLQSAKPYCEAMALIDSYEKDVKRSKLVFNDTVTKWNRMIRAVPSNMVAATLCFSERPYLEVEEGKKNYPDLRF